VNTAGEQHTAPTRAGRLIQPSELSARSPGRQEEVAHRLTEARPDDVTRSGARRTDAAPRRADEHAQAARSVGCPCHAGPGMPCGPSGDHLARYLHAEQRGAITRESLKEVIACLDVIAPQVLIQPPGSGHCTPPGPKRPVR